METFNLDRNNFKYQYNEIKKVSVTYTRIIRRYINFIKILNECIYEGASFNDEDRVTYRGIHKNILQNIKVGQTFRVINWMCTSESAKNARQISRHLKGERVIVICHIKKSCFNAGKLNKLGGSIYEDEKETLIPPYTVATLKCRSQKYYVIEVAKDSESSKVLDMAVSN